MSETSKNELKYRHIRREDRKKILLLCDDI